MSDYLRWNILINYIGQSFPILYTLKKYSIISLSTSQPLKAELRYKKLFFFLKLFSLFDDIDNGEAIPMLTKSKQGKKPLPFFDP